MTKPEAKAPESVTLTAEEAGALLRILWETCYPVDASYLAVRSAILKLKAVRP